MTIIIISVTAKPQAKVIKMETLVKEAGAKVISMFPAEKQRA